MFEKIVPLQSFVKTFFFIWNWFLINVGSYIEWFSTLDHKRIGEFSFLYFYFFIFWRKNVMIGMEKGKENFQLVKTFCLVSIFQVLENLDLINSFKLVKNFFFSLHFPSFGKFRLYQFSVIKIPLNNSSEIK